MQNVVLSRGTFWGREERRDRIAATTARVREDVGSASDSGLGMDGIESVLGEGPVELLVAVAAVICFMIAAPVAAIAYRLGSKAGRAEAASDLDRVKAERDRLTHELSVARLDLRDSKERRGKLDAELGDVKKLLGQRDLDLDRAEKRAAAIVDDAKALGGQYDIYRSRIRAAVDGEIWGRAVEGAGATTPAKSRIPILAVGNMKGGVGKSTIAANLGAYFADLSPDSARSPRRVLFVDLDFQGSLSSTLLAASGSEGERRVLSVFNDEITHEQALATAPPVGVAALNGGCRFFDCDPSAAEHEEKLLFDWVSQENPPIDLRLRLAAFLRSEAVQQSFDLVILDMPPRAGAFAYNAIAAATHMLIPTKHDVLSADAIGRFVDVLERMRPILCPDLKIIGIAPNMLRPQDSTRTFVEPMLLDAARRWRGEGGIQLLPPVPLRNAVSAAAGRSFAYLDDALVRRAFADLGDAVAVELAIDPGVKLIGHDDAADK